MTNARARILGRILISAAIAAILVVALFLLFNALKSYRYRDIVERLRHYPPSVLLAAVGVTGLYYVVLSFYDFMALKYVGEKVPYRKSAFVSFLGYVFAYNVGLSVFGSGAIRVRFYSLWGLEPGKIASIIAFCITTFWIGLLATGGTILLLVPPQNTGIPFVYEGSRAIGVVLLLAIAAYLIACFSGKAKLVFKRFTVSFPSGTIGVAQVLIVALDWCLAAYILYILLPESRPSFPRFLSIFMVAQMASATSHVPGGIGVLDTVLVLALSPYMPAALAFGSILAYRGIFYLLPFGIAVASFIAHEIWVNRKRTADFAASAAKAAAPMVPILLSMAVFIAGATLLFSAATPSVRNRLQMLDPFLPLMLMETSHFAASLVGLALLFIADALRRRVDAAYYAALGLLASGVVFSLLKGLEWEHALVLAFLFLLILPCRGFFFRKALLLSRPNDPFWFGAFGTVLAVSVWLGIFAYKNVQYSNELWWRFELSRDAPRFLRASLGVAVVAALVALRILLSHRPSLPKETLATCAADVRRLLAAAGHASSKLALLGDKFFHFNRGRTAFVMYSLSGRTCVVLGDPVGEPKEFSDLIWDFYELVRRQGLRVVWYEVSPAQLPIFVELGLRAHKVGEEALVDLADFTLSGAKGKKLRPALNKIEKEGFEFRVLEPAEVPSHAKELKAVSKSWLALKKVKEKGFSLGYFDESYLANFPCAVALKGGRIVAFATLWTSGAKEEAAVDLMRHEDDSANGIMEFLFVRCIEWAREQGFARFNLGIAPFSGLEEREAAPLWNRAIALIYRNGAGLYNFQGLRAFKSKFAPEWSSRYLICGGGTALAAAAADIVALVARGPAKPVRQGA